MRNESTEPDPDTEAAIVDAVSQVLSAQRGEMVTKLIVIAETIDETGQTALWICASRGLAYWDEAGMLEYATGKVRSAQLIEMLAAKDE